MNSLQLGLIAVGVLVVTVLAAFYWWQAWRMRRRQASATRDDGAVRPATLSQGMHAADEGVAQPGAPASQRIEPTIVAGSPSDGLAAADELGTIGRGNALGGALAAASTIERSDDPAQGVPVAGARVAVPQNAVAGSPAPAARPLSVLPFDPRLHVHASIVSLDGQPFDAGPLVAAAGRARAWVRLFRQSPLDVFDSEETASVQQLVLALPLASRAGPLSQADLDAWQFSVADATRQVQGEVHFHGMEDAVQRAQELDAFLAAVDVTPSIYLVKKDETEWTGTRLRATLEANGFRLQSDGRFAYHEVETDRVLFHAIDGYGRPFTPERLRSENFRALHFILQPVNLTQPLARFDAFRQSLRALAKLLEGELRLHDGSVVDEAAFAALRDEVRKAMDALVQAQIEPGSDTARSLFI